MQIKWLTKLCTGLYLKYNSWWEVESRVKDEKNRKINKMLKGINPIWHCEQGLFPNPIQETLNFRGVGGSKEDFL